MPKKLIVSSSPHIGSKLTTKQIMLHVIIALACPLVAGVVLYGFYSLLVVLVSVASCVLAEMLYNVIVRKPQTVKDLSAVVTGMILGLNMPPSVPLYAPIIGSIFAIMVVKMLFGGLGKNFANPAATARILLLFSWTGIMTRFMQPVDYSEGFFKAFFSVFTNDALVTSATPLKSIEAAALIKAFPPDMNLLDLFLGRIGGSIGESCKLAILLGGVYLMVTKIIDYRLPLIYIAASALFTLVFYGKVSYILPSLMTGGLLFLAFFMLTDYATSPNTFRGKAVFATGAAFMTILIRRYGSYPEGASIALLFMNLLVPLIDKMFIPKPYGYVKPEKKRRGGVNEA